MKHPGYLSFELFSRFLAALPKRGLYLFADLLFFIGHYLIGYRKKVVYANLKRAFPEKSPREIRQTALAFYRHLADVMVEDMAMLHMKPTKLKQFVTLPDLDVLEELYQNKRNVTGLLGHYGNWEFLTTVPLYSRYTILSVYKPLKNKFFNRKIYQMRKRFQEIPVPMREVYQQVIRHQTKGHPFIAGFVADQAPPKNKSHYWTSFLNQETAFFTGAEKIARKFNHTVIFTAVKKLKRGSYQVIVRKLADEAGETREHEITEKYVRALEQLIREEPAFWLWSHRRWKHSKP